MNREPWSDIGRLQCEVRQLQQELNQKVANYEIHEVNRRLDSMEHSLQEISSTFDGLQSQLQEFEDRLRRN